MLVVYLLFYFQEELVNWASTASEAERFRVLDCFKFEEKTAVQTKICSEGSESEVQEGTNNRIKYFRCSMQTRSSSRFHQWRRPFLFRRRGGGGRIVGKQKSAL
jgi:hypothetical protein